MEVRADGERKLTAVMVIEGHACAKAGKGFLNQHKNDRPHWRTVVLRISRVIVNYFALAGKVKVLVPGVFEMYM